MRLVFAAGPLQGLLLSALFALAGTRAAAAEPADAPAPTAKGEIVTYDDTTRTMVLKGNATLTYGDILLTADEIRYNQVTSDVTATGSFVLTRGYRRLIADDGTYNLKTGHLRVRNLRFGQFPLYLTGDTVEGTLDDLVFTHANIFFRDQNSFAPSITADKLTYRRDRIIAAEGLKLGLLGIHFLALPKFQTDLHAALVSYLSFQAGYRRSLGALIELGVHVPVAEGVKVGADTGIYTSRGFMFGPSGTYDRTVGDDTYSGFLRTGYISDHGDRQTDILGNPIAKDRGFVEWEHQQHIGDRFTLNGELNYWSDSAVLRDFKPRWFFPVQQPDSFLEGSYTGDNYVLDAFARVNPNRFFRAQERLPEIRFDLLPSRLPGGIYQRMDASFAVLEEDAYQNLPGQRSNRVDAYYGLERPIAVAPWLTFTPVAGGRVTYYASAVDGKNDYTRTIGEVGFDAVLHSSGVFNYKNELWEIDGLRHLFEPKLSYRYAPSAESGQAYIPSIDRQVFTTYLPPLSIADQRNVDQLTRLNTFRLSLNNTLQTRDKDYGSRDLAQFNVAADYNFEPDPNVRTLSDIYAEAALTPAPWLRLEAFERFPLHDVVQDELNYGIEVSDQQWWSVRLASHFLRSQYEQYLLNYRQRLNESYDVYLQLLYDARQNRFDEQTFGLTQRLGQTWNVRYEVSFRQGARREGSFGFTIQVDLLRF